MSEQIYTQNGLNTQRNYYFHSLPPPLENIIPATILRTIRHRYINNMYRVERVPITCYILYTTYIVRERLRWKFVLTGINNRVK